MLARLNEKMIVVNLIFLLKNKNTNIHKKIYSVLFVGLNKAYMKTISLFRACPTSFC